MAVRKPVPAYGRVDMGRGDDGSWMVIELELIEQELWLRRHPEAAVDFARAIERFLRDSNNIHLPDSPAG